MAGTTGNRGYTYPTLADANDVPFYIQTLAEAVDLDVAALNNPAPVAPVYSSGWGPYGGGTTFLGVAATRSASGLVGISGMVGRTGGTIAATTAQQTLLTLPLGYRPSRQIIIILKGWSGDGAGWQDCRVDVMPNGEIRAGWLTAAAWQGTGNVAWLSLAGLSFVAAP
ncbi:hypothetical protein [Cellulosimicrobium sp. SL-1]|uniref:hypothetical protein n=1 Tax=Cellulosimicrobium sp. SL-1 TaxID=2699423 RepID=UPI0013D05DB3|nr:hypothetical protein [Cellulosimicrobium sp. SL-1]